VNETRSDDRPLAKHRNPQFSTLGDDDPFIYVECTCGWEGYFDDGIDNNNWMTHLYYEASSEYILKMDEIDKANR
jgi:hypothetical protein